MEAKGCGKKGCKKKSRICEWKEIAKCDKSYLVWMKEKNQRGKFIGMYK